MTFEVATDLETTYKYIVNRQLNLHWIPGAADGKGIVKDEKADSWTVEKTGDNGDKSNMCFKNEVLVKNK